MPSDRLRCAYCNSSIQKNLTTRVPKQENHRQTWFDTLGENFATVCKARKEAYICLTHFEEVHNCRRSLNAIPKPLPFCNNNLGEKVKTPIQRKKTDSSEKVNVNHDAKNSAEIEVNNNSNNNTIDKQCQPMIAMIEVNRLVEPMEEQTKKVDSEIEIVHEKLTPKVSENPEEIKQEPVDSEIEIVHEKLAPRVSENPEEMKQEPVDSEIEIVHEKLAPKVSENSHQASPIKMRKKPFLVCTICGNVRDNEEISPPTFVTTFVCREHYLDVHALEEYYMKNMPNGSSIKPGVSNAEGENQNNQTRPNLLSIISKTGTSTDEQAHTAEK